jgi:hypothetical protein
MTETGWVINLIRVHHISLLMSFNRITSNDIDYGIYFKHTVSKMLSFLRNHNIANSF